MATIEPSRARRFVDDRGFLTLEGWTLVRSLWERTGGLQDTITNGTLIAQSGPVAVAVAAESCDTGGVVAIPADVMPGGDPLTLCAETMNLEPV